MHHGRCMQTVCGRQQLVVIWCRQVLKQPKNYHVAGLTRGIQRWIYSSAVKKGLETTFRSLDHKNQTRCCWTIRKIGLYWANRVLLMMPCLLIGLAELNLDSDSREDFPMNKKWLLDSTPLEKMSRYAVYIDGHLEAHFEACLFDPAPLSRIRNQLATFNTNVLYGVLREWGWTRADHIPFVKMSEERWSSVLDVDKIRGKGMMCTRW